MYGEDLKRTLPVCDCARVYTQLALISEEEEAKGFLIQALTHILTAESCLHICNSNVSAHIMPSNHHVHAIQWKQSAEWPASSQHSRPCGYPHFQAGTGSTRSPLKPLWDTEGASLGRPRTQNTAVLGCRERCGSLGRPRTHNTAVLGCGEVTEMWFCGDLWKFTEMWKWSSCSRLDKCGNRVGTC